ncbi:MAG TPA: Dabb family protein [Pyrinomonadaceae bacterium]|nr:Dabb family protein [Chloracidobacterium sp.]MBP9934377.1 Dabb family protein [Pyrinomonadaceae bacterium]MBK7801427.1 Dabb family protein [Chloracidobacterium sp.]MBK9436746.1 Dabb family protein [Chloracidobacterium sp.]MBL0241737.1 Dabb family protein [Chloracidobacterium sp.]
MLTHIVCWKYKPEASASDRLNHIEQLRALVGVIPEIISFEVGTDILHLDRSFDTGLVSTFTDRDSLASYSDHPEHLKVAVFGKAISERIVSVDFINE